MPFRFYGFLCKPNGIVLNDIGNVFLTRTVVVLFTIQRTYMYMYMYVHLYMYVVVYKDIMFTSGKTRGGSTSGEDEGYSQSVEKGGSMRSAK